MNGSEKFMGVLLILVMALIPLICTVAVVPVSVDEYNVVRSSASVTDVFSYYKSVFIIIFGVVIALAMAFQILGQDGFTVNFKTIPVILVGVMGLLILLSSLFSSAKTVAFKGVSERYEGAFVWLCYIAFFIVAMAFSSNIKRFSWILTGIMISGALVGLIALVSSLELIFLILRHLQSLLWVLTTRVKVLIYALIQFLQHFIIQIVQVCSLL